MTVDSNGFIKPIKPGSSAMNEPDSSTIGVCRVSFIMWLWRLLHSIHDVAAGALSSNMLVENQDIVPEGGEGKLAEGTADAGDGAVAATVDAPPQTLLLAASGDSHDDYPCLRVCVGM